MRTRLILLLGFATSALSAPAFGQLTEKQAAAQLKAAVKSAVKGFKADIKLQAAQLGLAIAAFEADIDQLDGSDAPVLQLFDDLQTHQVAVRAAWADADNSVATTADSLWEQVVTDGGDPAAVAGLTLGDGGALDQLRRLLRGAAEKSCDKLRKLLKQTIAKTAKGSTLNLRVRLDVPVPPPATAPTGVGVTTFSADELSIDVLVGFSRDGVVDDANVLASGTADQNLGNVEVALEILGVLPAVAPVDGRWEASTVDAGGLTEANFVLLATQGGGGLSVAKSIGAP